MTLSSCFVLLSQLLVLTLLSLQTVHALVPLGYQLDVNYSGSSFFGGFNFFSAADYTHGFVTYVDELTAQSKGLVSVPANGAVYIGVDSTSVLKTNGPGRASVRISSKKSWTHGLFILDLAHMPGSICGAWPAFWMVGPDWPNYGEVDIIEGVNSNTQNLMSLHTKANCTITSTGSKGLLQSANCDTGHGSTGCGILSDTSSSYGTAFNSIGGGVYATEWTSSAIKIWFFPRSQIPSDISSGSPDPSKWGEPQANMAGTNCDIDSHFASMGIVFDTTFCGDWATNVWTYDAVCRGKAQTCEEYVAGNPGVYKEAYWAINYLKVYNPVYESKLVSSLSSSKPSTKVSSTSAPARSEPKTLSSTPLNPLTLTTPISSKITRSELSSTSTLKTSSTSIKTTLVSTRTASSTLSLKSLTSVMMEPVKSTTKVSIISSARLTTTTAHTSSSPTSSRKTSTSSSSTTSAKTKGSSNGVGTKGVGKRGPWSA